MTRVAAIDCGTNSIRLLIADLADDGASLQDVTRQMQVVRLGQGVDRTGRFDPEALARTLAATGEYASLCRGHGVDRVRFVATSASRDASNRAEFFDGVHQVLGAPVEVISGAEEAALSFTGAISVLTESAHSPRLVIDIGGGSTELVLGADGAPSASDSIDIGCVRMSERHLHHDPPTAAQIDAARADIGAAIRAAGHIVDLSQARTIVGVAGSVTTVTAHAMGLASYQRERINGTRLPVAQVHAACRELLTMPRARRAELGFMHPGRVDVIGAGALIWSEVIAAVAEQVADAGGQLGQVVTSEHDILDGIALSLA